MGTWGLLSSSLYFHVCRKSSIIKGFKSQQVTTCQSHVPGRGNGVERRPRGRTGTGGVGETLAEGPGARRRAALLWRVLGATAHIRHLLSWTLGHLLQRRCVCC